MQLRNYICYFLGLIMAASALATAVTGAIAPTYCVLANTDNPSDPNRPGGIDILYVNGITNAPEDAEKGKSYLLTNIANKIKDNYTQGIRVGVIYNPTGGIKIDTAELRDQAQAEAMATDLTNRRLDEIKQHHPAWDLSLIERIRSVLYSENLSKVYIENFLQKKKWNQVNQDGSVQDASGDGSGSEFIGPVILKIVSAIEERLLSGRRVVIVAHSQGNLFIEAAYAILKKRVTTEQLAGLQVVGVAVVASTTPNDKWITIAQDYTVYKVYPTTTPGVPIGSANSPKGNFDAVANRYESLTGQAVGSAEPSEKNVYTWASNGHSFVDVYLNDQIFRASDHSKTLLGEIQGLVKSAIDSTTAPNNVFKTGAITASMSWINNTDMDLHVLEKYNDNSQDTHVYYSNKSGRIGYLDVDNTAGQGPEHYYTDTFSTLNLSGNICSDLKRKTLVFSVHPYSLLSVDEPVVLNIRVGSSLYSRSILIKNTDRGTYGKIIYTLSFDADGKYTMIDDL